jgi:uncharacterized protein YjiK
MINLDKIRRKSTLRISQFVFIVCAPLVFLGCKQKKIVLKSPPHYNFAEVFADKLDDRLKEISGLAWDREKNEFLAHYDEAGTLFFLDRDTKGIKRELPFGGKGDYEDVTLVGDQPYVLRSDGVITRVGVSGADSASSEEVGKLGIGGKNDFETMYYDSTRGALILICKNCESDDKQSISAYAYYIDSVGFNNKPVYIIDAAAVETLAPKKTSKFQPSAAAIHPILKKLFIISSASNLLVVADLNGKPEAAFSLSKKLFPQPEGITFNSSGDMYISNEGATGKATILRFEYRK